MVWRRFRNAIPYIAGPGYRFINWARNNSNRSIFTGRRGPNLSYWQKRTAYPRGRLTPSYTGRSSSRYVRSHFSKRMSKRARNKKRKALWARKHPVPKQMSKQYRDMVTSSVDLSTGVNTTTFHTIKLGSASYWHSLMQRYIQVGETDANVEREETIDLRAWNSQKLYISNSYGHITLKNNSSTSTFVQLYWVMPKQRTNIDPQNTIANGLDDKAGTDGGWELQPMFEPQDSKNFKANYVILKRTTGYMQPGDEQKVYLQGAKQKVFSEDFYDIHSGLANWPGYSPMLMIRIRGAVAHDSVATEEIGYAGAYLDVISETCVKFHFVKPGDVGCWTYTDGYSAFSNVAEQVQAHDPQFEVLADT